MRAAGLGTPDLNHTTESDIHLSKRRITRRRCITEVRGCEVRPRPGFGEIVVGPEDAGSASMISSQDD